MKREADFVIVGAGLTGSSMARLLSDAGHSVVIVERRPHVAGNAFDYRHESGVWLNLFGPHYFRTSSKTIWSFVHRFSAFRRYEARVLAHVDGRLEQWPVSGSFIRRLAPDFAPGARRAHHANFEDAARAMVPRVVYESFIRGYTEKQWGTSPSLLSARLANRIRVNWDDDARLTPLARYQGLPVDGYTALVERMIAGIPREMGVDFLNERAHFSAVRAVIFTGSIDEFFDYTLGHLPYRGQRRQLVWDGGASCRQAAAQVNEPQHSTGPCIRRIEWKQLMAQESVRDGVGTLITSETPGASVGPDDREYPYPSPESAELLGRYQMLDPTDRADGRVVFCGRLGEYRYLDMDQAIARAMWWTRRLLNPRD